MDYRTLRKEMIRNKVIEFGITNEVFISRRLSVIIYRFHPTDDELERGLLKIKDALDRYIIKSLEGFTFKTFEEISNKERFQQ